MLTQSSLSAFLPRETSYLSGYMSLMFLLELKDIIECLWQLLMQSSLPTWPPKNRLIYVNGLKLGSPPGVAFSHQSHGPASPPVSWEPSYPNGLSPGVLLGFHSISHWGPPEVSLMTNSAHCIVHQLYILCYCFIDSDIVWMFSLLFFWYWWYIPGTLIPITTYIASLLKQNASWKLSPLNILTVSPLKVGGPCNFFCTSVYVLCTISPSFTF